MPDIEPENKKVSSANTQTALWYTVDYARSSGAALILYKCIIALFYCPVNAKTG